MTIADQVRSVIAQHLGIEVGRVTDAALFRDDLGADSLDAFELLLAFEETFGLEITDAAADPMRRVSDAITYVESQVELSQAHQALDGSLPAPVAHEADPTQFSARAEPHW